MNRYGRGKSWNWIKRAKKRGDARGYLWLPMREAKQSMRNKLGRTMYGSGSGAELMGLDGIIGQSAVVSTTD